MNACSTVLSVCVAVATLPPPAGSAQTVRRIHECNPQCRISAQQIGVIEDLANQGVLGVVHAVAMDHSERVFVVSGHSTESISVFDRAGRLLGIVGRKGDGPGEFQDIRIVIPQGNAIHVLDQHSNRWTVLDRAFKYRSSFPLPHAPVRAVLWGDSLVLNAHIATADLVGVPLHVIPPEGGMIARSFGYDSTAFRSDIPYAGERSITVCPSTGVLWAAEKRRYVIEGYRHDRKIQRIARNVPWFEPHFSAPRFHPEEPPPPVLRHIRCDADGLLWVLVGVADPDWQKSLQPAPNSPHGGYRPTQLSGYFDTIIQVFDTQSGRLVASGRMDYSIDFFPADHVIGEYRESATGEPSLVLRRLALIPPRSE
jgi:hypothetical protein